MIRRLTTTICLAVAVLFGSSGCSMTPQEAADNAVRENMPHHRDVSLAAMRNGSPYIAIMCPDPFGWISYLPEKFDWFFERYGDRPLVEGEIINLSGTLCSVSSWDKVVNPSEQRKLDSNRVLAKINESKTMCTQMGFDPETDKFADCVLRITEMQSKNSPKTVIQNNTGDSAAILALLEEQKKQRQLEGSIELMRSGLEMMTPAKPKLTCKYNAVTKTTVCN